VLKEFKEFAMRGNVVDLAVDMIMPPIGLVLGKVDFSNLFLSLHGTYNSVKDAEAAGAPIIKYGVFINNVIDFLIVAFVIFLLIRGINQLQRKKEEAPAAPAGPTPTEKLLTEIRDELKAR